jgi:hypothetical protein
MVSDITKEEVQMSNDHHSVHCGKIFFTNDVLTAAGETKYLIRTGSLPCHYRGSLAVGGKVTYQLLEGATATVTGTEITQQNYCRVCTNTLETKVYRGPTYTGGTVFKTGQAGFGTNPGQAVTATASAEVEYVLKPNTDYIFIHTPASAVDMIFGTTMYELALS